jgi:hypothetical protein
LIIWNRLTSGWVAPRAGAWIETGGVDCNYPGRSGNGPYNKLIAGRMKGFDVQMG